MQDYSDDEQSDDSTSDMFDDLCNLNESYAQELANQLEPPPQRNETTDSTMYIDTYDDFHSPSPIVKKEGSLDFIYVDAKNTRHLREGSEPHHLFHATLDTNDNKKNTNSDLKVFFDSGSAPLGSRKLAPHDVI